MYDSTPSLSFISTLIAIHPLLPPGGTGHQVPSLEWPVALQVFEAHWPGGQQHKETLKILDRVCWSPLSSSFFSLIVFYFCLGPFCFPFLRLNKELD